MVSSEMVGDLAVGRYAVAEGESMNQWPSDRVGREFIEKKRAGQCRRCIDCNAWYESSRGHACDRLIRELVKFAKRKKSGSR